MLTVSNRAQYPNGRVSVTSQSAPPHFDDNLYARQFFKSLDSQKIQREGKF